MPLRTTLEPALVLRESPRRGAAVLTRLEPALVLRSLRWGAAVLGGSGGGGNADAAGLPHGLPGELCA
eukprot:2769633-Pyramimonas_sp.AAC.2